MAEKETVLVGCKLANGLRLHVMKRRAQPIDALAEAGVPSMAMFEDAGVIELAGPKPSAPLAPGQQARTEAFTPVDKELADAWFAENKNNGLVTSGTVFMQQPPKAEDKPAAKSSAKDSSSKDDSASSADDDKKSSYKSSDR